MADAALAVASVAVSCLLPAPRGSNKLAAHEGSSCTVATCVRSRNTEAPLRISLLLSLLLFSLGVLEAVPSPWLMMFLRNHAQTRHATTLPHESSSEIRGRIAVSSVYRFLLWADCIFIAVIVPAALGNILIMRFIPRGNKEDGAHARRRMNNNYSFGSGMIRALCVAQSLIRFVASVLLIIGGFLVPQLKRFTPRRHHQRGLPLVKSVQSMGQMKPDTMTNESIISSKTSGSTKVTTQYSKRGILGCVLGLSCSYFSLRAAGRLVTEIDNENTIALKKVVSQICALGVLVSSVLGAFGSVSMPYTCLMGIYLPHVSDHSIKSMQNELQSVSQSLATLQSTRTLSSLGASGSSLASPVTNDTSVSRDRGMSSFQKRCQSLARAHLSSGIPADEYEAAATKDEIEYLQNLHADIKDELFEMSLMQVQVKRSKTPVGRITGFIGIIFAVALLIRVGMAMVVAFGPGNRAGDNNERSDPITIGLSFLLGFSMIDEVEHDSLQQLGSLLLSAFLSVSQINMFLRTMSALNRRMGCLWRRKCQSDFVARDQRDKLLHSSSATSWLLAGIMGAFFLSGLVLMKMNLPRNLRGEFSSALKGSGDFFFDTRITNAVFALSSILTAAILSILFGIRRKSSNLHLAASISQIHGANV